jgi:hypothetical protein
MRVIPDDSSDIHHVCLSEAELGELRTDSLGEKLRILIANLPPGQVSLDELRDLVGPDGLLLLAIFLALVFMVPVQVPGLGGVFGVAIVLIGVSRLRGRTLWLPRRIAQRAMPSDKVRAALTRGTLWLRRLEYVSRPHRLNRLASVGLADILNNGALIFGALLLFAPIMFVPFSNTMPALAVLFLSIGLLQRDGLCILYGHLLNLATIVYFMALVIGGHAAFDEFLFHAAGSGP